MDLLRRSCSLATPFYLLALLLSSCKGATFTFVNKCGYTVWPGILPGAGTSPLETTGFQLARKDFRTFQAPPGWSGRFWARTGCTFDSSGHGSCATGDCGSGLMECNGAGAAPPATLAEFWRTLYDYKRRLILSRLL
uniref:Thaumatin-like protein n=1 Tax=Kalanchoe fedtschenkoi TaxID=63787 RepID=A0A7N0TF88_KALFE